MALSTTSSRRRRVALPSVCMLLQQYSLDHKSGHAHRGRGAAHRLALLMACQTMQTGPLLPPPLCIHWLRCGLNLYGTRRFYPPGTRRFYLYSLAECRSPNSPLLAPPLLRLGFVGVLTSVPVALVIIKGRIHTLVSSQGMTIHNTY